MPQDSTPQVSRRLATSETQWMAVCTDGHGVLTPWLNSYDEANEAGRTHSGNTQGHRWDVNSRDKP